MPEPTLSVFDPNITATSPAGSCLLKMLRAASVTYKLQLFAARTDLELSPRISIRKLPLPRKPVFLESILFSFCSAFSFLYARTPGPELRITTQGGFPFCHISYAHCCHKLFLTKYRQNIGGGFFRRTARLINQSWSAWMEALAFRGARLIVVPSQGLARELTTAYGPELVSKLRLIPNPVDCQAFAPPDVQAKAEPFTFVFCALGNFEWKGLPLVLDALASGISARLVVVGGTHADIERYSQIHPQATFTGLQKDIRPHLWAANAFVFPSVYETFPLVCLQAAAAGLPLIATDLYGIEDLLQPGVSGWRVERTVESVAAAMRAALENPAKTAEMGRNAQFLAQQYDEPAFQQRWLELLAEQSSQ